MQLFRSRSSSPQKEPRESGLGQGSEDESKREGEENGHAQRRSIHYARLGRSSLHSNPLAANGGRRSIASSEPFVPDGGGDSSGPLREQSLSFEAPSFLNVFQRVTSTLSPPETTVPYSPPSPTNRLSLTLPRPLSVESNSGGMSSPPLPDARGSFRFMHENSFQV